MYRAWLLLLKSRTLTGSEDMVHALASRSPTDESIFLCMRTITAEGQRILGRWELRLARQNHFTAG